MFFITRPAYGKKTILKYAAVILLLIFFASCGQKKDSPQKFRAEFFGPFDTDTIIIGYADSEDAFSECADAIYKRMIDLHNLYDIYNEYEGINNLYTINQQAGIAPVAVRREIIDLLLLAREAYEITGGVTNVAMGSVLKIWHEYRTAGIADPSSATLPDMEILAQAAKWTDISALEIDDINNTVFLRDKNVSLDVGSIAKGYAVQLVADMAREMGIGSLLLSAGGNVMSSGKPPDRDHWDVGIQDPFSAFGGLQTVIDIVRLTEGSVVCSGGYQRFYQVNGETYHHIINPATLMPADRYAKVTVVHTDSAWADILSTALFIMPFEEGRELALRCGAEAMWVYFDGNTKVTDGYAGTIIGTNP